MGNQLMKEYGTENQEPIKLSLNGEKMSDDGLENNEEPIKVSLNGKELSDDVLEIEHITNLVTTLKQSSKKTHLEIVSVPLHLKDTFTSFLKGLDGSTSIVNLHISGEFIDDEIMAFLEPVLESNTMLSELSVVDSSITIDGLKRMRKCISSSILLTKLKVSLTPGMDDDCVREITEAVLMREMDLDDLALGNNISSSGIERLSQIVVKKSMDLCENDIGDLGAESIASALLLSWKEITSLNLSSSNIGNKGVKAVTEALKVNRTLKTINFGGNQNITDVGGQEMLDCIYNKESFEGVLSSNHILSSCCFLGCQLSKKKKRKIGYFCGIDLAAVADQATRQKAIIRRKIAAFIESTQDGELLEGLDVKLMPHMLSFIQQKSGLITLHAVMRSWNFPQLFSHPPPHKIIEGLNTKVTQLESENKKTKSENLFLKKTVEDKDREIGILKRLVEDLQNKRQRLL